MKSVLNAHARRNMDQLKDSLGPEALERAAQAIRLRSEDASTDTPASSTAGALGMAGSAGQILANDLSAKRVGNMLYMSGVVAFDPAASKVVMGYENLPAHALEQLRSLGYCTGQMSVDIFEAPIVAQSWFVLQRIQEIAMQHGAQMSDVFKLVQYFRDLRHYPAYNRVRQLFCPAGVVSTVVEVSRMVPTDEALIEVEATAILPS